MPEPSTDLHMRMPALLCCRLKHIVAGAASLLISMTSSAEDGRLVFDGALVENTCHVRAEQSMHVRLPDMPLSSLTKGAPLTSAGTPFRIRLEGCDTAHDQIAVAFTSSSPRIGIAPYLLENIAQTNAATGVGIGIYRAETGNRLSLDGTTPSDQGISSFPTTTSAEAIEFEFLAKYVAVSDHPAKGKVHAEGAFDIIYP
jgi:type 1 fimbria pilin